MIRDVQGDDIDFYVTDELEKRLLIKNYHPIFKLEVSQLNEEEIVVEEPQEENKITILTDPIFDVNNEHIISINVEDYGGIKYRKLQDEYIKLNKTVRGYYSDDDFFSDYTCTNSILNEHIGNNVLFIDNDTQQQYIIVNDRLTLVKNVIPGVLDNNIFTPFFAEYNKYPTLDANEINPDDPTNVDVTDQYFDNDTTYDDTYIFITYENAIQLVIRDINNTVLHTAYFPHLVYGSVEYPCVFTQAGLYRLEVTLIGDVNKEQSFDIIVTDENDFDDIVYVPSNEVDEEEEQLYLPNTIDNRIINPRINRPTNLKCSLQSLVLNNNDVKNLLNSNRSNILFTSPTNKDYQIYQFESHNIYDTNGDIQDTWFFIRADFIDEYIEMHILPTYINAMDNIILISDNDFVDYLLHDNIDNDVNEEEAEVNETTSDDLYTVNDNQEYRVDIIDGNKIVIANVPICSEPQFFDMTYYLSDSNYKISFDCYSSYYYRSIFYINDLKIYAENNNVYLEYHDVIDIIPYDLLCRGEHTIEFSIEDERMALGIDDYIVSTDIFDNMATPTEMQIGFQQTKVNTPVTESLSVEDIDSYTYLTNLIYEPIIDDNNSVDVTVQKIQPEENQETPKRYKFPLNLAKNLARLEIDIIRKGIGSYIVGVIDRTNLDSITIDTTYTLDRQPVTEKTTIFDSYDETTLLDHTLYENSMNTHVPIQYNNDAEHCGVFLQDKDVHRKILDIEQININDDLPNHEDRKEYQYQSNSYTNIIQTLKYFNDDLYSETYMQKTQTLADTLALYKYKQYYNQNWFDKEQTDTEYFEVNFNDQA